MVLTIVYYFFRYTVKTDEHDKDVIPSLASQTELSKRTEKLEKIIEAPRPQKLKTLEEALAGTKSNLWGRMASAFQGAPTVSDGLQNLEEVLFTSDLGPVTAQLLLEKVGDRLSGAQKSDPEIVKQTLKSEMLSYFPEDRNLFDELEKNKDKLTVWMVVGVNGAGKTTTIGKLASLAQNKGLKTMIVAGDTFRAAADSQLRAWSEHSGSLYYSSENTKDPSAVAYQALEKAKSEKVNLVLVDTAGRLHTQENLMEELKKMKKIMSRVVEEAPHETLIVLDANNGQNALEQARQFHRALSLSGAVLTKLDGTSKGGVAVGLVSELQVPLHFIGIGESVEDLRVFSAQSFVDSIL